MRYDKAHYFHFECLGRYFDNFGSWGFVRMKQSDYIRELVDSAPPLGPRQQNAITGLVGAFPADLDFLGMPSTASGGWDDAYSDETVDYRPLAV